MCFESSELHDIKKWQSARQEIQKFLKETFEVSIKTFYRKWEGESHPKWFLIYKQFERCQNECQPDNLNLICFCRRTSLHVLMFPISLLKWNLWSHWKWQTFEGKVWQFFMTSENRDLFSWNTFVSYICLQGNFFQEYIAMELKLFFICLKDFPNAKNKT